MLLRDEAVETLRGLGLTLNETRVYLALLQCGVSSAKTASKFSGVTRQDVYRVMPKLQQKGLVARTLTVPAMFEATPLEDGVSILMKKRRKRTYELQQKTTVLLKNLGNKKQNFQGTEPKPWFVVIPSKASTIKRAKMTIDAAINIDIICSRKRFLSGLLSYGELTLKRLEKGVRYRVITEMPGAGEILPKIWQDLGVHPLLGVRYVPRPPKALMNIYDDKEVLFSVSTTDPLESTCLWSNNPSLLAIFHDYFEILWITAIEESQHSTDESGF